MCVFVPQRGAFCAHTHTQVICHILGVGRLWRQGGLGRQVHGCCLAPAAHSPSSPCIPASSSPPQGGAGSRTATRASAALRWWEGLAPQPWGPGGSCRCAGAVTPLGWGIQRGHRWDVGKEGAQPYSLFWGSLPWPHCLSQDHQILVFSL